MALSSKAATGHLKKCLKSTQQIIKDLEKLHKEGAELDAEKVIELTDDIGDRCDELYEAIAEVADEVDPDDDEDDEESEPEEGEEDEEE